MVGPEVQRQHPQKVRPVFYPLDPRVRNHLIGPLVVRPLDQPGSKVKTRRRSNRMVSIREPQPRIFLQKIIRNFNGSPIGRGQANTSYQLRSCYLVRQTLMSGKTMELHNIKCPIRPLNNRRLAAAAQLKQIPFRNHTLTRISGINLLERPHSAHPGREQNLSLPSTPRFPNKL